ncbi:MAG: DUF4160 domain-containing protein [Candidatus Aminicenantes bacterium]|nr:DUF4160 domain-containing protein [Candidatus Aminicenantes bacterium]
MPKLYEYFGLIVLFYSNDHYPIHVHGKYQGKESKAELVIVDGCITEIKILPVRGKEPLDGKEQKKFRAVLEHFKGDIVKKWIDFFVLNKEVKPETINNKLD